jgi:hypothetical protein
VRRQRRKAGFLQMVRLHNTLGCAPVSLTLAPVTFHRLFRLI